MEGIEIQTSLESDTRHRYTAVDSVGSTHWLDSGWTEFYSETKSRDEKLIGYWTGEKREEVEM